LIQDRVRNEIDTVMEEHGGKFTMNVLENLSYLDRCIKESLRLYPPGYQMSRVTGEDVKLRTHSMNLFLQPFFNILQIKYL